MATSDSESESESEIGYDTDVEELEDGDLANCEAERTHHGSTSGKKFHIKKRSDLNSNIATATGCSKFSSISSYRYHKRTRTRGASCSTDVTHLYSPISSNSAESDVDVGCSQDQDLSAEISRASCSKMKDQAFCRPAGHQGTSKGKQIKPFNPDLVSQSRKHSISTESESETDSRQEGAVTFKSIKKHHRHRHKRPKLKLHDQENMTAYKKNHQHSMPRDLSLYHRKNNILNSGMIPVDMNFNIRALIHPSYISRDDVVPLKRRKKTSVSSDSEAVSDNEAVNEPLPVIERRPTSLSRFEKEAEEVVYTISDSSPDDEGREVRTKSSPKRRSSDSDVICLDSDSDHKNTSLPECIQPIHVDTLIDLSNHPGDHDGEARSELEHEEAFIDEPPKPIPVESLSSDISDHDHGQVDDGAESDSSDLPECPILEEMSKVTPFRTFRTGSVASYNEQPLLRDNVGNNETTEREYVRTEAARVPSPEMPPVCPSSPPDDNRSRHSSGDLDEPVEQPMDACWGAFLFSSLDTKASDLSVRKYQQNQRISRPFSQDKRNAVHACSEEGFTQAAVNLIAKFTTTAHKPPTQLLQELFHDTLRKHSSSHVEASIVYRCLKRIQHLHHPNSRDLPIEWNLIKSIADSLVSAPSRDDLDNIASPAVKWHIDLLSFHFLVSVLEDDVERKARWDTLKKSFAFSILKPDTCRNNCREVVEWIHRVVSELEPLQCGIGSGASTTSSRVSEPISCGCQDNACHRNYVLPMLGKLLELSFRMTNSWNLKAYLERTVEELNSCGIRGLPQLRLMFETLQQPWLRLKLSDLIFNSHFEAQIFGVTRENITISRIVEEYFLYLPRPMDNDDEEEDGVMKTRFSRSSQEQMVYLLLVMLQSYLKCCSGSLPKDEQGRKSSPFTKSSSLWSSLCRKQLSEDDRICLLQMGDYVDQLRNHLTSSSHPHEMSLVTEVCLAQMSVLYEWM